MRKDKRRRREENHTRTDEVIDMIPIPTMAVTGALHPIDGEGVVATIIITTTTIVMTPSIIVVVAAESIGGNIGMIVDVAGIEMETIIEDMVADAVVVVVTMTEEAAVVNIKEAVAAG